MTNEEDGSVKSPRSNEPIKSRFGLNATVPRFNEKTLAHNIIRPTLVAKTIRLLLVAKHVVYSTSYYCRATVAS